MESAIVSTLVTITLPMVIKEIKTKILAKPDLEFIQSELEMILAKIGGPRWKAKKTSDLRRTWIEQLTRLAADIEYCLDNFLVKTTSDSQFAREIRDFKRRIKDSSERIQDYVDRVEPNKEDDPPTPVMNNDAEEDLLTLLDSQSEMKAKVISAIGSGGQNTDLARRVYEKDEVRRKFSQRAWVSAVDQSLDDLLTEILGQFEPGLSPSDLRYQLESRLRNERYLIVIADVRTEKVYSGICNFPWANGMGGKIIVTTNIQPVGRACVCGDTRPPLVPDGSPASMVLVGEVVGNVTSYEKTCFTLYSAAVARTEGLVDSEYERVLLEDCLLYFSMFPRAHSVRRNPLIRRCMAEGIMAAVKKNVVEYVHSFDEEIVAHHLDILIGKNIIQSVKKSNNGKMKRCQPPGMVFNHICDKAVIENFFTLLCGQRDPNDLEYVRRLSLHPQLLHAENGGLNVPKVRRLLTMVVFPATGAQYGSILRFDQHKLLRVLDLKECDDLNAEQFADICDLFLLKYLSLGNSIDCVPRKIRRLKWLETLDMRTTGVVTVYSEVLMMPKLKHLLGKFELAPEDCPPKKGAKKFLRLNTEFANLKEFLSKNSVLETLGGIFIGNVLGLPQLVSHMLRLRKVKIWCDSTPRRSSDLADLMGGIKVFTSNGTRLTNVDYSLSIDVNGCASQLFLYCLEGAGRLTSLKLSGNVTPLPPVSNTTLQITVQELCLSWTNLSGATIQIALSNLRCGLKFLKLTESNLVGLTIQDKLPFDSLERICLVGVQSLGDIIIEHLGKLVSLHLLCETLGALPGIQIRSLRNLEEVGLHSGVAGDIKRRWEDAAMEHQRKPKLVSIEVETH